MMAVIDKWQFQCPICHRLLEKETLAEPWRCICGWNTENTPHDRDAGRDA